MGLVVEIQSESSHMEERFVETDGALTRALWRARSDSFPMLRWLDSYADTVFNSAQMEGIRPELQRLRAGLRSDGAEFHAVEIVERMAALVADDPHARLVFIGD